jgi:hypothetical protein
LDQTPGRQYFVARAGNGSRHRSFVYIPQPGGTVVIEVKMTASHTALFIGLGVLAMVVLTIDIALTIMLRRSTNSRFS